MAGNVERGGNDLSGLDVPPQVGIGSAKKIERRNH
jgi:hypothetical protein